ncbi:hypothetical protein Q8F55_001489 [Vanrija albida]|uniref:Uncharacterized protein n=1 Tax=Vanrija albida TaxID=181172 RepID=A0ABR3QGU2_9TREE
MGNVHSTMPQLPPQYRPLIPTELINPLFFDNPDHIPGIRKTGARSLTTTNPAVGTPHPIKSSTLGPKGTYAVRFPWWRETVQHLQSNFPVFVDLTGLGAAEWLAVAGRTNAEQIITDFNHLTGLAQALLDSLETLKTVLRDKHGADPDSSLLAQLVSRQDYWMDMVTDYKDWRWQEDHVIRPRTTPMRVISEESRDTQSQCDAGPKSHLNRCDPLHSDILQGIDASLCYGQLEVLCEQIMYVTALAQAIMEMELDLSRVPIERVYDKARAVREQNERTRLGMAARQRRLFPPPTVPNNSLSDISPVIGPSHPSGPSNGRTAPPPPPAPAPILPTIPALPVIQHPVNTDLPQCPPEAWAATPKLSHFLEDWEPSEPGDGEPDEYGRRSRKAHPVSKRDCEYSRRQFVAYRLVLVEFLRVRGGELYHNLIESSHDQVLFNAAYAWKQVIDSMVEPYMLLLCYISYDKEKLHPFPTSSFTLGPVLSQVTKGAQVELFSPHVSFSSTAPLFSTFTMPIERRLTPLKLVIPPAESSPPPVPRVPSAFFEDAPWGEQNLEHRILRTTPQDVVEAGNAAQTRRQMKIRARTGRFASDRRQLTIEEYTPSATEDVASDGGEQEEAAITPTLDNLELVSPPAASYGPYSDPEPLPITSISPTRLSPNEATGFPLVRSRRISQKMSEIADCWREAAGRPLMLFSKKTPAQATFKDEVEVDAAVSVAGNWGANSERTWASEESDDCKGDSISVAGREVTPPSSVINVALESPTEEAEDLGEVPPPWGFSPPLAADWVEYNDFDINLTSPNPRPAVVVARWASDAGLHLPVTPTTQSSSDKPASDDRPVETSGRIKKPLKKLLSLRGSLRFKSVTKRFSIIEAISGAGAGEPDNAVDSDAGVPDSMVLSELSFGTQPPEHYRSMAGMLSAMTAEQPSEGPSTPPSPQTPADVQPTAAPDIPNDTANTPPPQFYHIPGPGPVAHLQLEVMFATEPGMYPAPHASSLTIDLSNTPNWLNPSPERTVNGVAQVWEDLLTSFSQLRGETVRRAYIPLDELEPPSPDTAADEGTEPPTPLESEDAPAPRLTRRLSCRAMSTLASPTTPVTPGLSDSPSTDAEDKSFGEESLPTPTAIDRPLTEITWRVLFHHPQQVRNTRARSPFEASLSDVDEGESVRSSLPPRPSNPLPTWFDAESNGSEASSPSVLWNDLPAEQTPVVTPGPEIRPPKPTLVLGETEEQDAPLQNEPWGAITAMLDTFAHFAFEAQIADTRLVEMAHGLQPFYLATAANPAADRIVFLALITSLATTIIASFPRSSFAGREGKRLLGALNQFVATINALCRPFTDCHGIIEHLNTRRISKLHNMGRKVRIIGPTMRLSDFMAGVEAEAN